jgi:hypothetical protein
MASILDERIALSTTVENYFRVARYSGIAHLFFDKPRERLRKEWL